MSDNSINTITEQFDPNIVSKDFRIRDKAKESQELRNSVSELVTLLDLGGVPNDIIKLLSTALDRHSEIDFDEDFNVREELVTQMKLVRAIRNSLLESNGRLKEDTTVSEVKSVLDASIRLSEMLNKVNKDLINHERLQAVEAAFMETISGFDKEIQLECVKNLEKRLKEQKALVKK